MKANTTETLIYIIFCRTGKSFKILTSSFFFFKSKNIFFMVTKQIITRPIGIYKKKLEKKIKKRYGKHIIS